MATLGSIDDVRERARRKLPRLAFDFIDGGADAERTLRDNVEAFGRLRLEPRYLVDVSSRDLTTSLFGETLAFPLLIAPTGMAQIAGRGADIAGARAAAAAGVGFTLSTMSSHSIEAVARGSATGTRWFQLYLWRDAAVTERLVARAQAAGYGALVVTIDVPVVGRRLRDVRNGFVLPPKIRPGTAWDLARHPRWLAQMPSAMTFDNITEAGRANPRKAMDHARLVNEALGNPSATWEQLSRLRSLWTGPLLVKGILSPHDARLAVQHGADGLIVSNHGGRQLDDTPATLDVLANVVRSVGTTPVLIDGGVRRGSDIVKALGLGATACMIGRPWLYGLAAGGQSGVEHVLDTFRHELDRTLALTGRPSVADIGPDVLWAPG